MKEENLIHIKLEYDEAVQSKSSVLSLEMNLLRIMKNIRQYNFLRIKELKTKTKLRTKIREFKKNINSMQLILPKIKMPKLLQKEEESPKQSTPTPVVERKPYNTDLEMELRDIQEKLKALHG